MAKIYKYQVENELKDLKPIDIEYFRKMIDRLTMKENRIVFFRNKDLSYYSYYCTSCKKWHKIDKKATKPFSKNDSITCVNCGKRFKVIFPHNVIEKYDNYLTKIEVNKRNEVILRVFYYSRSYDKRKLSFSEYFTEVARINTDHEIAMKANSYVVMGMYGKIYHGNTGKGFMRDRSGFYKVYSYRNVVNIGLKRLLKNTWLKYSAIDLAKKHNLDLLNYIIVYKDENKVELLMKAGCTRIIKDLCTPGMYYHCGLSKLHRANKKQMQLLVKYNLSYNKFEMLMDSEIYYPQMLDKACDIQYRRVPLFTGNRDTLINYLYDKNYRIGDYSDYLQWCSLLGMDLNDKRILYPDNPTKAHDDALAEKVKLENRIYDEKINEYSKEFENLILRDKKMIIRPAASQKELIYESEMLHHCVRTYASKMAARNTCIMFIRKRNEEDVPYVTLELKGDKVIQCRANNNAKPKKEVISFVNKWCLKNKLITCFN